MTSSTRRFDAAFPTATKKRVSTMSRISLLSVALLCFFALGCGKDNKPTADKPTADKPAVDEKQFQDFLTATRDWQEKTKHVITSKDWDNRADPSRMEDVINRGQPDSKVALAQSSIMVMAGRLNVALTTCGISAIVAELKPQSYQDEISRARRNLSIFGEAVDAYSSKDFENVKEKRKQYDNP